jgi:hypothetical protein
MAAFSGGIKMASVLNHIEQSLGDGVKLVRVGFLEGSHAGINNDQPAPEIALILENGAPAANIPPRPFFRGMITKRNATWGKVLFQFLKNHNYDVRKALLSTGLVMGEQLQLAITEFNDPPDKDWAIKAKGHTKPLEWSKNMKRSISAEVDGTREACNGSI